LFSLPISSFGISQQLYVEQMPKRIISNYPYVVFESNAWVLRVFCIIKSKVNKHIT
jgi:hypothetical protein